MEQKYDSWDMVETIWRTNPGHGPIKKYLEDKTMWKCLEFCYLFPPNHEFHGADMIRLWVAEGFFHDSEEYKAGGYFQEFEHMQIFLLSHLDYSTSRRRYTLNKSIVSILEKLHNDIYVRIEDDISYISENTLHTSLQGSSIDPNDLEGLYEAEKLCTLLILHEHGSCIDQVPRHLFLKLPLLCVLDLSHTNITELPSSIGNLKALKYLNLSGTLITTLPNSLCSLDKLQTLKLRGCVELLGLPKGLRKLINLRHLDVDVDCLLDSMPPGLGNLRKLQTLPAFVVGKEDGCHITELVSLVNLRGTLRIMKLENVSNSEEAKQLYWYYKPSLSKLELQWTELKDGLEILENIQPPRKIKELQIRGYGGVKFPGWIGTTEFSQLATITLCDCPKCEFLPPLGNLPSLKRLHISDMHAVKKIDSKFCVRFFIMGAFQRLENLTLNGMPQLEKWSGIKEGDFPHLQKLSIIGCPKLATLPQLALLKSLRQFEINICASLKSFPSEKLPTSLQYLVIIECPLLKERCRKDEGPDWVKIAHVPNIKIDYQQISDEQVQITHKLAMENKGGSNPVLKQIKVLAKSGRGIVQLVRNEWTGQLLALKGIQVKFQEDLVKHITTQLKVNQSAQCPHIAVCYRSAYDNGVIFIIMEYMDGGSLADLLKKVNSIPEPYLAAISKQVLKGLLYLHHDRHIIHRNLKPSNLLINHRGEVKITDTGVGAILATSSAEYMSPERISGSNYSYKTDIWSLGLVLLESATGCFPYSAPKQEEGWSNHFYELMEAVVDQHPPCPSSEEFSPEFCSFISSCLQKDPMHRQTAHELMEHPFISKYNDLNVDLAAYFTRAGSPVLLSSRSI